jgi:carboxyl-terminal processing protease
MSTRIPSTTRSLVVFSAALIFAGSAALWAIDTPPAPPVGNALPAGGAAQEPGSDHPKPNGPPTLQGAPATTSAPVGAEAAAPVPPKQMVVRADRDFEIERTVGRLLEEHHYLQRPIDAEMSQRWLGLYLRALDENRIFFLQSDIDEFTKKYGNSLGDLLHGDDEAAAVSPAFDIFQRFLQRVRENVSLAQKLVHEKHDFNENDSFTMPTNKSPWLKDKAASEALWSSYVKSDLLNGVLDKKPLDATAKRLDKRYDSLLRYWSEMNDLDVLEQYLCGLTHAYDPHSDYFQPDESENFSIQAIDHSVTGIGAELRADDGYAVIEAIISGGPADLDKRLKPGDKILAVGQGTKEPVDAVNMRLNHVVDMIRGEKGTMVHLVIQPAGAGDAVHKDIVLKRDTVSLKDSLAKADIIEHPVAGGMEKVGVIHLHDFYNNPNNDHSASADCAKLITRLKKEKVAGIILDMRSNGGGLLDQAIELTALFVKNEPVVQVRRSDGDTESLKTENSQVLYNGPLVVLVNKMSASATEIVAAALQDYGRAVVVGDKSTHGKGTVQTLIRLDQAAPLGVILDPGNELKMTVQKFYRVAGGSTQEKGVIPDIVLPSLLDAFKLGETTLPYYLPYDTISPVPFDRFNLAAPYIADLKAKSDARVAASTDFDYLKQDIAFYKKRVDDTTVSLNEASREKETVDLKATELARKKDLEARKAGRDKDLELTLDMVEKNQPAAVAVVKKPEVDPDDDSDDTTPDLEATINAPVVDPQLNETVNILTDYVKLLQDADAKLVQSSPAAATPSPGKQSTTP